MTRRIQNNPFRKNSAPVPVPGQVQPQDFDKFRSKAVAAPSPLPVSRSVSPVKKVKRLDPDLVSWLDGLNLPKLKNRFSASSQT